MKKAYLINWNDKEARQAADLIGRNGWEVSGIESKDGGKAYKAITTNPPDAVIIYLTSKPDNGWETAQALRNHSATRDVPILFVGGPGKMTAQMRLQMPDAIYTFIESLGPKLRGMA